MFKKAFLPIAIGLIVLSVVAGMKFRPSAEQLIDRAEQEVYDKSLFHHKWLGWYASDLYKMRKGPAGSEIGFRTESLDERYRCRYRRNIFFQNGNILTVDYDGDEAERLFLVAGEAPEDHQTIAQVVLLICMTTNDKATFREVCDNLIPTPACGIFTPRRLEPNGIVRNEILYHVRQGECGFVFGIEPVGAYPAENSTITF